MDIPVILNKEEWESLTYLLERNIDLISDNMSDNDPIDEEYNALLALEDKLFEAYKKVDGTVVKTQTIPKPPEVDPLIANPD
jgi:hypothetical protein